MKLKFALYRVGRGRWGRMARMGYTLIEIMIGLAIIGILAAIGVFAYSKYVERAQGVDIVVRYDAVRTSLAARDQSNASGDCVELAKGLDTKNLAGASATLAYGFEAVTGGYRPVLTVCADAGKSGPEGVRSARGAYETLAKNGVVEKNPVVSDSVVSFALRLTQGDQAYCKTYTAQTADACSPPMQAPRACPPGQERLRTPSGNFSACIPACGPGQTRDQHSNCVAPPPPAPSIPGPASCPAGADRLIAEDAAGVKQWMCFDACPSGQARQPGSLQCTPIPEQRGAPIAPPQTQQQSPSLPAKATPTVLAPNLAAPGKTPVPVEQRRPPLAVRASGGWLASIDYQTSLPVVGPADANAGRWYSVGGAEGTMTRGPTQGMQISRQTWVVNTGDPECGVNGYHVFPRPATGRDVTVIVPCKDGSTLALNIR